MYELDFWLANSGTITNITYHIISVWSWGMSQQIQGGPRCIRYQFIQSVKMRINQILLLGVHNDLFFGNYSSDAGIFNKDQQQ